MLRYRLLSLLTLLPLLAARVAHAHPLMAEPVNHPLVFTFDQFFLPEDPDEHLMQGGFLLLAELNCAACHTPPTEWLPWLAAKPGPQLRGISSRMKPDMLWLFIRSPQHFKKGTQMPGLFSSAEGDEEEVEALLEYLTATQISLPSMPAGDAASGRALYHQTGCVACHEPAADYRPTGTPPEIELDRPGNASVPIVLADVWDVHSLAAFLQKPLTFRPAGRMPDMHLTAQEAADIAAYLHLGRTQPISPLRAALAIPPQGAEKGRQVFQTRRCSACHELPEQDTTSTTPSALPMRALRPDQGCLAVQQKSGTPRYDLRDLQIRALRLALSALQDSTQQPTTHAQKTDWHMSRLNCYACHDRAFKGGPEDPRAQYFSSAAPTSAPSSSTAHLPPSLDGVGTRLSRQALTQMLLTPTAAPTAHTRMPLFGPAQVTPLLDLLSEPPSTPE